MFASKFKKLIEDAATYGASGMVSQVVHFLLLPVFTRFLTPEDYGVLAVSAIYVMIFTIIANAGSSNAVFRYFNTKNENQEALLTSGTVWVLLSSTVLGAICLLSKDTILHYFFHDQVGVTVFLISTGIGFITTVNELPNVVLRAQRKVRTVMWFNLAQLAANVSVAFTLVVVFEVGVIGVLTANLVATFLFFLVKLFYIREYLTGEVSQVHIRKLLKYGYPMIPHRLQAVGISQFGQYMVLAMMSVAEAGLYSMALKMVLPLSFLVSAFQQAWVPYKFEVHAKDPDARQFFSDMLPVYVVVISLLWVAVSVWGGELVRLVTTEAFHDSAALIPFVALIPVGQGMYFMLSTGFEFGDNTNPLPFISALGLGTVFIGGLWLTPHFGAGGAALATFLAWLVMASTIFVVARRRYPIEYRWGLILSTLTVAALMVLFNMAYIEGLAPETRVIYKSLLSVLCLWGGYRYVLASTVVPKWRSKKVMTGL